MKREVVYARGMVGGKTTHVDIEIELIGTQSLIIN